MKRPCVQIKVTEPLGPKTIYSTGDAITGSILFTPDETTRVDNLSLDFEGNMEVAVENMVSHVAVPVNTIKRRFLRMNLPVHECIPQCELQRGTEYTIPFDFVVPNQLPAQVCHHRCSSPQLQQEHLRLPPSLGQTQLFERSDDMTPKDTHVSYTVKFTIWKDDGTKGHQKRTGVYSYPVFVLPKSPELAPILIPPKSRYYQPIARKSLNKGILRSTVGSLIVSTSQPPAIELSTAPEFHPTLNSTKLQINLAFEPAHADDAPPRCISTRLKLKAMTFYGVEPWEEFPDQTHPVEWDSRVGYWDNNVLLSSNKMTLNWTQQPRGTVKDGRAIYTASVELIGCLPNNHVYPPTFHSCFVSRVYALSAMLEFRTHDKAQRNSKLSVAAPVQIIA